MYACDNEIGVFRETEHTVEIGPVAHFRLILQAVGFERQNGPGGKNRRNNRQKFPSKNSNVRVVTVEVPMGPFKGENTDTVHDSRKKKGGKYDSHSYRHKTSLRVGVGGNL